MNYKAICKDADIKFILLKIVKEQLTKRQAEVFCCIEFENLNQEKTAEKLGISQSNVSTAYNRAKEIVLGNIKYVLMFKEFKELKGS